MATTQERLTEAEAAFHALSTGRAVAEIRDQNGETIRYNKADLNALRNYIKELTDQINGATPSGPMRFYY